MHSSNVRSARGAESQIIHYSYRRPGFIRMEFVEPHRGAVLVYTGFALAVRRLWAWLTRRRRSDADTGEQSQAA